MRWILLAAGLVVVVVWLVRWDEEQWERTWQWEWDEY